MTDTTNDTLKIPCTHCRKPISIDVPDARTEFSSNAVPCPHCKQMNFLEVTTESDPDSDTPRVR